MDRLLEIDARLRDAVDALTFAPPVAVTCNPLRYAWAPHARFVEQYGAAPKEVVFVGMNPGPFGMAQTGVPFGDVGFARDWLGVEAPVGKPAQEHPKRPIEGFALTRREVSGSRLWGWAADRFGTADAFFSRFYVINYCPLLFLEASGRNRTPDKLPAAERAPLFAACDRALHDAIAALQPGLVVGVGAFAEGRAAAALSDLDVRVGRILHPSPASPAANRGWAAAAERQLTALGVDLPGAQGV